MTAVELIAVGVLLSSPLTVSAGAFSFFTDFLFNTDVSAASADAPMQNSQTMALLKGAINSDPNPSKGGGDITVVDDVALLAEAGPSGTIADIEPHHASSDQISIYVVRPGDTLSQIATMFNVSSNTIRWANDLGPGKSIQPGQTLVILPISGVRHTVKKGDTLKSIASKYGGELDEVLSYNALAADAQLAVGDVVVVPNGEIVAPKVTTGSTAKKTGATLPSVAGYYIRPVSGIKTQGLHGYNGIDIGAPAGTPIVAAAAGEVIVSRNAGWNGGYGNYVVIKHGNGTQTLYAHNSQNIVYAGDSVVQGQVVGYVGNTGKSTGTHLHFEVRGAKNPF